VIAEHADRRFDFGAAGVAVLVQRLDQKSEMDAAEPYWG